MVVFDATMLSLLFRPGSPGPLDPATGARVEHADLRVAALVEQLEKARTVIIIPTPVLSEVLIKAGNRPGSPRRYPAIIGFPARWL